MLSHILGPSIFATFCICCCCFAVDLHCDVIVTSVLSPQHWIIHLSDTETGYSILGCHYNDVIMSLFASQITSLTIVYSTVYSDADQRKHQSAASLAFVRGIHRGPVNSPHKGPVTRKMFPFDDVIMYCIHKAGWMKYRSGITNGTFTHWDQWYGRHFAYDILKCILWGKLSFASYVAESLSFISALQAMVQTMTHVLGLSNVEVEYSFEAGCNWI